MVLFKIDTYAILLRQCYLNTLPVIISKTKLHEKNIH